MSKKNLPFWESKTLCEMTEKEWEALCDGCAICCLHKVEDEDSKEVFYTYVACKLLDIDNCTCTSYQDRFNLRPDCLKITPKNFSRMYLLPETCAYRRLNEGKKLEWWHPLISQNPNSIHQADISVREKVISEENVHPDEIENYIFYKQI